jgi:copper chaperone
MITFKIDDMTCGHCVSTLTRAIQATDPGASLTADLATHRLVIEPRRADAATLSAAIEDAGYTPVRVMD